MSFGFRGQLTLSVMAFVMLLERHSHFLMPTRHQSGVAGEGVKLW